MVARVPLTLAVHDYDHVRDLASGVVSVEGVSLTCLHLPVEEIFFRFTRFREWDVSELSLAKYASLRAAGDDSLVAIPVFTSRAFRHSAIFILDDGPLDDPARPRRRAHRRAGVDPDGDGLRSRSARARVRRRAERRHAGSRPGRTSRGARRGSPVELPPGVSLTPMPEHTLNDLLLAGEIDALIAAHPPLEFERGSGRIVRLFSDYRTVEERLLPPDRRLPDHARRRPAGRGARAPPVDRDEPLHRLRGGEAAQPRARAGRQRAALPGALGARERRARAGLIGADFWPYGIERNRRTLETFLEYAFEQGVCARRLTLEELFVPEVQQSFRV